MTQDTITKALESTSRRDFLVKSTAATGALAIGFHFPAIAGAATDAAPEITHWVVIQPDDTVVIRIALSHLVFFSAYLYLQTSSGRPPNLVTFGWESRDLQLGPQSSKRCKGQVLGLFCKKANFRYLRMIIFPIHS